MSDSKKDAVGGHRPKPPGYEWIGRRSTHLYEQTGRHSKKRASKLHRRLAKVEVQTQAAEDPVNPDMCLGCEWCEVPADSADQKGVK